VPQVPSPDRRHHHFNQGIGISGMSLGLAQVNGGVREWQEYRVQEAVIPLQSPSPLHLG
jgi:hypothetical protein